MRFKVGPSPSSRRRLKGLSARLMASHYENNYGGAVRRLNAIRGELAAPTPAPLPAFALNGLKREDLIAANSMILHEVYFDAWAAAAATRPARWRRRSTRDFGSVARWRAEFTAMGKALGGGSGWVVLTRSPRDGTLDQRQWAADHTHALAGGMPVLALDMYEHAYHLDFGANAAAYVDAFMANLYWQRIAARFAGSCGPRSRARTLDRDHGRRRASRARSGRAPTCGDRRPSRRRRCLAGATCCRRAGARRPRRWTPGASVAAAGQPRRWSTASGASRSAATARPRCASAASMPSPARRAASAAWRADGLADRTARQPKESSSMKWVTRERPKIDRIACPWLIARFIDKEPEFLYVPAERVLAGRREERRDSLRHSRRRSSAMSARNAASTPSSPSTGSTHPASTGWPTSCAAPTPRGPTSRRSRPACSPSRSASARSTPTTTRCCATAW